MGLISVVALAGCAAGTNPSFVDASSNPTPAQVRVAVTRGDITPVLTLPAQVVSSASYSITASSAGTFESKQGVFGVSTSAGFVPVVFRALDRDQNYLVPVHGPVVEGLPIATAVYSGFALQAQVAGAARLQLQNQPQSARAQVDGSGGPFDCELLDPRPTLASDGSISTIACIVPADQDVLSGLTGVIAIRFASVRNVLKLPVEAVAGTRGSALVYVQSGKSIEEVPIKVGSSDGIDIEVISGLTEGQKVTIPSPSLLGG